MVGRGGSSNSMRELIDAEGLQVQAALWQTYDATWVGPGDSGGKNDTDEGVVMGACVALCCRIAFGCCRWREA